MRIHLKEIKPEGILIKDTIPASDIGIDKDDFLQLVAPVNVTAKVFRADDVVIANCIIKSRYHSYCARSMEEVQRDWTESFDLEFPIDQKTEYIELDDDIRQEVIVRIPLKVLSDRELAKERDNPAGEVNPDVPVILKELSSEENTHKPFDKLKMLDNNK